MKGLILTAMTAARVQRCCILCLWGGALLLGWSHTRESHAATGAEKSPPPQEMSYSLCATQLSAVQSIGPEFHEAEKQKFVRIELSKVSNPQKSPILFEVYFQGENREKVLLGTFSPYPPDNTGTFIVPTKGQIRVPETLVLSMVLPKGTEGTYSINVQVKKFTFREK